jgi:hypothetical protein
VLSLGLLTLSPTTGNPCFVVVLLFVLIGIALTGTSLLLGRREAGRALVAA